MCFPFHIKQLYSSVHLLQIGCMKQSSITLKINVDFFFSFMVIEKCFLNKAQTRLHSNAQQCFSSSLYREGREGKKGWKHSFKIRDCKLYVSGTVFVNTEQYYRN